MRTIISPDCSDFMEASEFHVSGVYCVDRVGAGLVRVRYFQERLLEDGRVIRPIVLEVLWDAETYSASLVAEAGALAAAVPSTHGLRAGAARH